MFIYPKFSGEPQETLQQRYERLKKQANKTDESGSGKKPEIEFRPTSGDSWNKNTTPPPKVEIPQTTESLKDYYSRLRGKG